MMSSARDEHDTVPPPAGEEDAYSAATKVGAMPAELMARLRAEGLLPEEPATEQQRPPPPVASLTQRVAPPPAAPPRSAFDDLPELTSDPPPPASMSSIPAAASGGAPWSPGREQPVHAGVTSRPPAPLETPVTFVSQPPMSSGAPVPEDEAAPLSGRSVEQVRAFRERSKVRTTAVLVAVLVALVAFAFVMALLSQRR